MVIIQSKSKRKPSGARYKSVLFKNRQHLVGRIPALTKINPKTFQGIRARSNSRKLRLLTVDIVNLYDPKSGKYSLESIKNVVDSPADKNYVRRKIMVKGSVIETARGNARITSRPGQHGVVNAVLI